MNSKEALRNIVILSGMGGFLKNEEEIIKQALERLEQLEKENKGLEKLVWKKVEELVNEEHRSKELYDKNIELKQENTKLKQAIRILKDKKVVVSHLLETKNVEEYNFPFKNFSTSFLTQEEYKLLIKEVLDCD